ncbi:MAG: SAM-dependent methyltransferase [Burkholderiaceae bacterium]
MTVLPRPGALVLVPNALDFGADAPGELDAALPLAVLHRAASIGHWVVEDAKSARAFLRRVSAAAPLRAAIQAIDIRELPRPAKGQGRSGRSDVPAAELQALLEPTRQGEDVALLSEAGLPAVADPGAALVRAAHGLGLRVEPLPGPSALMLALAASGLDGQQFAFVGYLPVNADARAQRIRELESHSRRTGQTQIAIETPYRNGALLQALLAHLQPDSRLSVACALTWPEGWCRTLPVKAWRAAPPAIDNRLPAVFLWQAA